MLGTIRRAMVLSGKSKNVVKWLEPLSLGLFAFLRVACARMERFLLRELFLESLSSKLLYPQIVIL